MTYFKKTVFLVLSSAILFSCEYVPTLDDVIPDNRTEYKKSRALPDLEVPPDLTIEEGDDRDIPGEPEPTTLSAYQRHQKRGGLSELQLLEKQYPGEKVVPLPGRTIDIWPRLREYLADTGYDFDLDDAELGVLETNWREAKAGSQVYRDKLKFFAEPAEDGKNTILFISSERQDQIKLGDGGVEWLDQEANEKNEESLVTAIKREFYGDEPIAKTTETENKSGWTDPDSDSAPASKLSTINRAEIEKASSDKVYLSLPESFKTAWQQTAELLDRGGMYIEDQDPEKGLYYIVYSDPKKEEESGLLDKLKFWGDDDEDQGKSYQISLTGVGDKTEVVVLNAEGDWETSSDATSILNVLMNEYNRAL